MSSTGQPDDDPQGVVEELTDAEGQLTGYSCKHLANNVPISQQDSKKEAHTIMEPFYFGFKFPIGESDTAARYINAAVVERVAATYNITSELACLTELPLVTDHSWLVSIQSNVEKMDMFGSCRVDDSFDPERQDCHMARLNVTGTVMGLTVMPDVVDYVENLLQGVELTEETPYHIEYFGGSDLETHMFDDTLSSARDNLNPERGNDEKTPITMLGKALISLMGLTVVALIFAVRRQRRQKRSITDQASLQQKQVQGSAAPPILIEGFEHA
jgi:hypothetical protein